jgi:hypothetical protein
MDILKFPKEFVKMILEIREAAKNTPSVLIQKKAMPSSDTGFFLFPVWLLILVMV